MVVIVIFVWLLFVFIFKEFFFLGKGDYGIGEKTNNREIFNQTNDRVGGGAVLHLALIKNLLSKLWGRRSK